MANFIPSSSREPHLAPQHLAPRHLAPQHLAPWHLAPRHLAPCTKHKTPEAPPSSAQPQKPRAKMCFCLEKAKTAKGKVVFCTNEELFCWAMSGFLCGPSAVGGFVFLWCSVWLLESVVPLWDSVEMSDSQTVNFAPSDETRLTSDETRLAAWSPCLFWWSGASCHVYSG